MIDLKCAGYLAKSCMGEVIGALAGAMRIGQTFEKADSESLAKQPLRVA